MSIIRNPIVLWICCSLVATTARALSSADFEQFIDFDDIDAGTLIMETHALTTEYLDRGVVFSSTGVAADGGCVLVPAGAQISGYSPPNILLFNCLISYPGGGGAASGPERIDFVVPATRVSVTVGTDTGTGYPFYLTAYDMADNVVATDSITMASSFQALTVTAPTIAYVVVGTAGWCMWGMDDLGFDSATVPSGSVSWGQVKATFR